MIVRPVKISDLPTLRNMHAMSGLDYKFPDITGPMMESVLVIESDGVPVAACAAERITQLYLWMEEVDHPAAKLHYVKILHEALATELRKKGYTCTEAYIPPQLEKSFGRRLMRNFGWVKSWPCFTRHF
jgi:hypothetical protein